jgi:NAD(P)H-hydrate epimerase
MKAIDPQIIQEIDRRAIEDFFIPRLVLMENAGRQVAENCLRFFKPKEVLVVCGAGYNGGDGLVATRYLSEYVREIKVILVSEEDRLKEETKVNLEILKRLNINIINLSSFRNSNHFNLGEKTTLIIDAIIGIGLKSQIKGFLKEIIDEINKKRMKVISVDIPSGLSAKDGSICGGCIRADMTVTFTFAKKGMFIGDGPRCCGKIRVVDVGIPQRIIREVL